MLQYMFVKFLLSFIMFQMVSYKSILLWFMY